MRILYLIDEIDTDFINISKQFKDCFVMSENKAVLSQFNLNSIFIDKSSLSGLFSFKTANYDVLAYASSFNDYNFDLIHCFSADLAIFASVLAYKLSLPLIYSVETEISSKNYACLIVGESNYTKYVSKQDFNQDVTNYYKQAIKDNKEAYLIKVIKYKYDYLFLYLDKDDEKLKLDLDISEEFAFKKDYRITIYTYNKLKEYEKVNRAYRKCLNKLALSDKSEKQIKDFLFKEEINARDVYKLIDKLKALNLIDDRRYCENVYNQYLNNLNSYNKCVYKLKKDGIKQDIIDSVFIKIDEKEKIYELALRYQKQIKNKSLNEKKNSIKTKLYQQGFDSNDINDACLALNFEEDENNEKEILLKQANKQYLKLKRKYKDKELINRLFLYLRNKGFKSENINEVIKEITDGESEENY